MVVNKLLYVPWYTRRRRRITQSLCVCVCYARFSFMSCEKCVVSQSVSHVVVNCRHCQTKSDVTNARIKFLSIPSASNSNSSSSSTTVSYKHDPSKLPTSSTAIGIWQHVYSFLCSFHRHHVMPTQFLHSGIRHRTHVAIKHTHTQSHTFIYMSISISTFGTEKINATQNETNQKSVNAICFNLVCVCVSQIDVADSDLLVKIMFLST